MYTKKNLVFLHGWGASSKVFVPLFYYLKNDYSIHTPDLPGFGVTPIEKPMTLKDYADTVYNFLKNNNIQDPIIVGHSFGGAVAIKMALLYPDSVSKLILVGAAAIRQPNIKTKALRKISELLSPIIPKKIRVMVLRILNLEKSDYSAIQNPLLKETFNNVINEDLGPLLPLVKTPTLVIWGEKDTETPLDEGELVTKSIPGARLEIIKNAGHFTFLEKPEEFINLIKEFVS